MHDQAARIGFAEKIVIDDTEIAIAEVKFHKVGIQHLDKLVGVTMAHRNTPRTIEARALSQTR